MNEIEINKIYNEGCIQTMRRMPDKFVDSVITSPPYWGLRDYNTEPIIIGGDLNCEHEWGGEICQKDNRGTQGSTLAGGEHHFRLDSLRGSFCKKCGAWRGQLGLEPTPELYVQHLVEIFRGIRRVLKDDGTVWLNIGDSYAGSWGNYGARNGNQRSRIAERWHRPAYEDSHYGWNGLPPTVNVPGLKPKNLIGIPWRVAFALQAEGWYLRSDIIWAKPNALPESVKDRPTKSHEYIFLLTKSAKYYYDAEAIAEPIECGSRAFSRNNSQARKRDDGKVWKGLTSGRQDDYYEKVRAGEVTKRNKRDVWIVATKSFRGAHFAVFPEDLIEPCMLAGVPQFVCKKCGKGREKIFEKKEYEKHNTENRDLALYGENAHRSKHSPPVHSMIIGFTDCGCNVGFEPGIVYDPFMGSGTVAKVALRAGRRFIGSELNPEYCDIANKRIAEYLLQGSLF